MYQKCVTKMLSEIEIHGSFRRLSYFYPEDNDVVKNEMKSTFGFMNKLTLDKLDELLPTFIAMSKVLKEYVN